MTDLSDKYNTDLAKIITSDNVQFLAESITICALKNFLPHKPSLEKIYFGLIRDIHRKDNIRRPLSDGYDFVQTAACFLCQHIGKALGDTVIGKYKKPVTVRHACFSEVGSHVYKLTKHKTPPLLQTDVVQMPEPFEENGKEKSLDRVDEIIKGMKLTQKQMLTLDCYQKGMGVSEIARQLSVNTSTVWRSRMILQRKYNQLMGLS